VSDSRDLIDKTDALLGRYRGNTRAIPESDFPLLTDVYDQSQLPISPPEGFAEKGGIPASTGIDPRELREAVLVDEILRLLAPHIEEALGDPLRDRLDECLRRALAALTEQVRIDIETLVRDAVSQAVDRATAEKR
jgi:hypothetical protein